jgi:hypothetical protein
LKVELSLKVLKQRGFYQNTLHEQKMEPIKIQTLYDNKVNEAIEKEYGTKESIYKDLAHQKGFDLSKRQLTGDDLLWYGKETQTLTTKTGKL